MQKINIIATLLLMIAYLIIPYPLFNHGNMFHLLGNIWCLWISVNDRLINKWLIYPIIMSCGYISLLFSDTIGFSGALYAMIGISFVNKPSLRNLLFIIATILLSSVIPTISLISHIIGFLIGIVVGCFALLYRNLEEFYYGGK